MSLKYKRPLGRGHWQVQEAKARFSELFRKTRTEGAQRVSHHGKETVVLMAEEDFLSLQRRHARRGSLVDFFAHSPLASTKLDLRRSADHDRPSDI
ncbi:MAG: type II toxin-antitoxin system Phd/YefM family antitoxin [Elusimicrobia bacterium]|nr:type II toxin-antitoxin system Phd/YefM family antitoxin [Elusimicrobiota bacterium]